MTQQKPPPENASRAAAPQDGPVGRLELLRSQCPHSRQAREAFLAELMRRTGAIGGVFWLQEETRQSGPNPAATLTRVRVEHSMGLQELGALCDEQLARTCSRLVLQSLASARPELFRRESIPSIPAGYALVFVPLLTGRRPTGAVQLFLREEGDGPAPADLLPLLAPLVRDGALPSGDGAEAVSATLVGAQQSVNGVNPERAGPPTASADVTGTPAATPGRGFDRFLLELHRTLRLEHVALTAVNDGRQLLGCDRVSLAVRRGGRLQIAAISGIDRVNRRADATRSLLKLAGNVVRTPAPVTFTGDANRVPPQLERPMADYVHQSGARMIHLIPLQRPDVRVHAPDEDRKPGRRVRIIGCLILESFRDSQLDPDVTSRAEDVAEHVAVAVHNAMLLRQVPAVGLWRLAGAAGEWLHGRRLTKALLVVAAIAAIVGALALVPFDYRLTADGRLLPTRRQRVFAPWDGDVVRLFVESGQHVTAGTPLLQLENEELRQQLVASRNELEEKQQQEISLQAEIETAHREGRNEEEVRLRGELLETRTQIAGLAERVAVLQSRYEKLRVVAPNDGVVTTFQLRQLLQDRPVARGEQLLEIMREEGPWELTVEIPDHRMGHLLQHLQRSPDQSTEVEFVLQTDVEKTFTGRLTRDELGTRTSLDEEGKAVVEARIALPENTPPRRRIGAAVTAKIDCGPMNLGYVLFGDVVEFLRRHLWL